MFGNRRRNWREIGERVSRWRPAFVALGADPGERVAILMRDCRAVVLVVDKAFALTGLALAKAIPGLKLVYANDDDVRAGMEVYEALLARSEPMPDAMRGSAELAGIFYTGGTTGRSKGVMLSHGNLMANALGEGLFPGTGNVPKRPPKPSSMAGCTTATAATWTRTDFIYVVDRVKDMVISGGENIFSVEVENAIAQHPAVAQCAVIGIPNEQWGEQVHAVVVSRSGAQVTAAQLIEFCKTLIAGHKCPRSVEISESPLPLSGAGKILKRELRRPFWENRERLVS